MTASATIDLTAIMQPQTDAKSGSKISAADASSGFASVLDNASKNYGSDNSAAKPANYTTKNTSNQNNQAIKTEQPENKTDVSENNTEKTSETLDTTTTNQSEKVAQDENKTQQVDNKVQDTNQTVEQKDTQNPEAENNASAQQVVQQVVQQTVQEVVQQPNQEAQQAPEQPTTADEITNAKDIKKDDEVADTNTATLPIENLIQNLPTAIQAEIATATANTVQNPAGTQNNQVQTAVAQAETVQDNLNVDLTNLADNSAKIANVMGNNTKIQTQTQQALSNVKINPQDTQQLQAQQVPAQQAQTAQATEANTIQTQSTQTPVIEVSEDIAVLDSNTAKPLIDENNKSDIQNVLKKTAIIQEAIDKTNAKITNVETNTSNQNSNNLLNNQSAQEQVVKLTIENNSVNNKVQTVAKEAPIDPVQINQNNQNLQDAALKITTTNQANFAQTLNNVQTQNQAPQELNKTNILNQIENQINAKQLQTGETTKVNIILQPENLGKITLELVNTKEGLTAKMTTDNEQVKELLSKHLDNLKETMSNQGINVGNLTVKVDETQKQSNEQSNFNNWQAKQENQEFSNNAQNQNQSQNEASEKFYNVNTTEADIDTDMSVESEPITEKTLKIQFQFQSAQGE